jgi:sugar lactone lactonase YvrE
MSAASSREVLLSGGSFFECPRWHDGQWWASDFYRNRVVSVTADGASENVVEMRDRPSGLGWLPDGSMLVVSMMDWKILRRFPDGRLETHADLTGLGAGHLNDMVVDRSGYAFVGSFGFDLATEAPRMSPLIRVAPDGSASLTDEMLWMPNGMVVTPDGKSLIVGETLGSRLTEFTLTADRRLSDRQTWAAFGDPPQPVSFAQMWRSCALGPDGCCLDSAGQIWVTDPLHSRCLRIARGGEVTDQIVFDEGTGVFACMLGGAAGTTLVMAVAPLGQTRQGSTAAELVVQEVSVPRAGLP